MGREEHDHPRYEDPLDEVDPRFGATEVSHPHERELVASRGPFPDPDSRSARFARVIIPAMALAGLFAIGLVFFAGLNPGSGRQTVGPVDAVRAAVGSRPHRVCLGEGLSCAWLTIVDGELIALNTNGPLSDEYGRQGVGWCPTSGRFGANATGSRYDAAGRVVSGPAPRGLDRFHIAIVDGQVIVDFTSLQTGTPRDRTDDLITAHGQACASIPFDREADLVLPEGQVGLSPG